MMTSRENDLFAEILKKILSHTKNPQLIENVDLLTDLNCLLANFRKYIQAKSGMFIPMAQFMFIQIEIKW